MNFLHKATDHHELQHHEMLVSDCGTGKAEEIHAEKYGSVYIRKTHLPMNMHTVKVT